MRLMQEEKFAKELCMVMDMKD